MRLDSNEAAPLAQGFASAGIDQELASALANLLAATNRAALPDAAPAPAPAELGQHQTQPAAWRLRVLRLPLLVLIGVILAALAAAAFAFIPR